MDTSRIPPPGSVNISILFEQYKLAVEMAAGISARRQAANTFFIGLVSSLGAFDALVANPTGSARGHVLLILPICWCVIWWLTIQSYRRINIVKWEVIEELEASLPARPFTSEGEKLESISSQRRPLRQGSFAFTKLEAVIPILVGFIFLLLAARPLLEW